MKIQINFPNIFTLLVLMITTQNVYAQNEADVMRYSYINGSSTARAKAIGGATGSIGADFSGISVNPATLGRYTKKEFSLTFSNQQFNTNANFYNTQNGNLNSKSNIDNIGIVMAHRNDENAKWKSSAFAIGLNSFENYSRNYNYSAESKSSITDYWAASGNANGGFNNIAAQGESVSLAFNTGLIDTTAGGNNFYSVMPDGLTIQQGKLVRQTGSAKEIVISVAGNRNDKWLIGATLGVPLINYTSSTIITEDDRTGSATNYFNTMSHNETLISSGGGVNIKGGVVYTPTKAIRLGASLTSPSKLSITDFYNLELSANTENAFGILKSSIEPIRFEYDVTTPAKALLSGSYIFGSRGFATADYEVVNYAGAKLSFGSLYNYLAVPINNRIKANYTMASNIRLGAEWRLKKWAVRGGYARYGSPLKVSTINNAQQRTSAGIGYRAKSFFVDAALVRIAQTNLEHLYKLSGVANETTINNKDLNIAFTMGWKFL